MRLWNRFLIVLIFLCLLSTCINCDKKVIHHGNVEDPLDHYEVLSDTVTGRVYFDATVSMEGFVKPGEQSKYCILMRNLRSGFTTGWPKVNFEFYKFGARVKEVKEELYQDVMRPHFYQDADIKLVTNIPDAIDHSTFSNSYVKNTLTIFVTDLFQTDNDIDKILKELNSKFLSKGLVVGLLGIKSQFDGTIYDVGIDGVNFPYKSDENSNSYRPFYLIIIGHHSHVENFFENLNASQSLCSIPESNFIIFSHHLTKPLASFKNAQFDMVNDIAYGPGILIRSCPEDIQQFLVRSQRRGLECSKPKRMEDKKPGFGVTVEYKPLNYIVPFDTSNLEHEAILRNYTGKSLSNPTRDESGLIIKDIALSGEKLKFKAEISPRYLKRGTHYYEIILKPEDSAYKMPEWISQWNMQNEDRDGTKTINLVKFADDLWRTVIKINKPKIAKLRCYIKI